MGKNRLSTLLSITALGLSITGCSTTPSQNYAELYRAPIPSGYTKKNDLVYYVKKDIKEPLKNINSGFKIDSTRFMPGSDTKVSARGLKVNVPWENLEGMFGQKD